MKLLRRYLIGGLVVWIPVLVTFLILRFIVDLLDQTLSLIPVAYQPQHLLGVDFPGLGVVISLVLLISTGVIATNFFGQKLVSLSETFLNRIPLVRSIYYSTKQVIQAVLSTNSQAFRKVLLVEYPRKGLWSIAFQTGVSDAMGDATGNQDMISIFIPTTPNPTSGFLMMVKKSEVIELSMSIDEALKFIISLGVMNPLAVEPKKQAGSPPSSD